MSVRVLWLLLLLALATAAGAEMPLAERRSGYADMSPQTRAMQDDDVTNPATLWILDGEALWAKKAGAEAHSSADCHRSAQESMKGAAARHPAFDAATGNILNLEGRINRCRAERQKETALYKGQPQYRGPLRFESEVELLHSEWWQQQWAQREYRIARNPAGERFWLFRDNHEPEQWYLHGLFGCGS